jgi:hypothetical protein
MMLPQNILQRLGIKGRIFRNLINHIRQVREEIPLVPIRQDGRHARVVELDLVVANFNEVDGRVDGDEVREGCFDDLADGTL